MSKKKTAQQLELIPETLVNRPSNYDNVAYNHLLNEKARLESRLVMIDDFLETLRLRMIKYVG